MSHAVLMSEPPKRASGLVESATLYKGVMLSARPMDASGATKGGRPPFISAGHVEDHVGYPPVRRSKPVAALRKKTGKNLMRRHRKWLDDLQAEREKFLDEQAIEDERARIRLQNFKDRSSFVRRRICNSVKGESSELTEAEVEQLFSAPLWKLRENDNKQNEKRRKKDKRTEKKPTWARTEQDNEFEEDDEISDLLEFTSKLDFKSYIDDLELRCLLQNVKERVSKLNGEGPGFAASTTATKAREEAESDNPSPSCVPSLDVPKAKENVDEDNEPEEEEKNETERIVTESRERKASFKTVHSKNSLRKVVETVENAYLETIPGSTHQELPNPLVVIEDSHIGIGRAKDEKLQKHVQTLPYLHRNPAI